MNPNVVLLMLSLDEFSDLFAKSECKGSLHAVYDIDFDILLEL